MKAYASTPARGAHMQTFACPMSCRRTRRMPAHHMDAPLAMRGLPAAASGLPVTMPPTATASYGRILHTQRALSTAQSRPLHAGAGAA